MGQAAQHQLDHGEADAGDYAADVSLEVAADQTPLLKQSSKIHNWASLHSRPA
jgi:hypothetical protein